MGFGKDIESVLYIDKTGCAFVNYRTKEACNAAIARFNATELDGSRLDSRNDSVEAEELSDMISCATVSEEQQSECYEVDQSSEQVASVTDRYFVLKSFSQEDLDDSRHSGVWTAQPSIQKTLHAAFATSKNVYLVFSANKSGAYYGYARMTSSPFDDQAAEQGPKDGSAEGVTITKVEATASAPRGRIVNDPARATLFWEAERDDRDGGHHGHPSFTPRTFNIEWKQVRTVEFFRVRSMKNTLNGNKEVKVAKDGTELETSIGKRIIDMFDDEHHGAFNDYQPRAYAM
ncbi:Putative YTH domain containing protein [Septoria linicola]|uniref:YTH domain containing protein n=1 Tax=Septoria linicola TaxID=215465 RepID=A0A9Q9EPR9_9PEZI|nr:putative YTH domain containing protein [Septoria linicola]USW59056.1 Putative YTH domain containing protein [Septoria linicola]